MKALVLEQLKKIEEWATVTEYNDEVEVVINDFDGFNDNWEEVEVEYDEEAVEEVEEWLEEHCERSVCDFYSRYYFEGFCVCISRESDDI